MMCIVLVCRNPNKTDKLYFLVWQQTDLRFMCVWSTAIDNELFYVVESNDGIITSILFWVVLPSVRQSSCSMSNISILSILFYSIIYYTSIITMVWVLFFFLWKYWERQRDSYYVILTLTLRPWWFKSRVMLFTNTCEIFVVTRCCSKSV